MINFYLHTPYVRAQNEKRAIFQMARLLQQKITPTQNKKISLICNINPDQDPALKSLGLPQLDALLIAPNFVAILELKNYYDPIEGRNLKGGWFVNTKKGKQRVLGGSKKNPYLQIKNMRSAWSSFFASKSEKWPDLNWHRLHSFLLFSPYLHPKSKISIPPQDAYYMQVGGINDLPKLIQTTSSPQFDLDDEQSTFLINSLNAKPWKEIYKTLTIPVGFIHVVEPNKPLIRYPIHPFDEWTIGRSATQPHHIQLSHPKISGTHGQLVAGEDSVFLYDVESRNGIFSAEGERIMQKAKLGEKEIFMLGDPDPQKSVQIWLEPFDQKIYSNPTQQTI